MAKIKKLESIQEKRSVKDCCVKLKRLDRETIERSLNSNRITYNIRAKIPRNEMTIDNTTVLSKKKTFNVVIKMTADRLISINDSNVTRNQPISDRILRPKLPAVMSLDKDSKPNHNLKFSANGLMSIKDSNDTSDQPISIRILRPKLPTVTSLDKELKTNQNSNSIVTKQQSKSITKMVQEAWTKCKADNRREKYEVQINDVVMAKIKGYTPWPATVIKFLNKNKVKVQFFGVQPKEMFGFVNIAEITPFAKSINVIHLTLKRDMLQFNKAVQEAQLVCSIPSLASICDGNL